MGLLGEVAARARKPSDTLRRHECRATRHLFRCLGTGEALRRRARQPRTLPILAHAGDSLHNAVLLLRDAGTLKRLKLKRAITKEPYLHAARELAAWFRAPQSQMDDIEFLDPEVFRDAIELAEHTDLDLSDAFQLNFQYLAGDSKTLLVTADAALAQAARQHCRFGTACASQCRRVNTGLVKGRTSMWAKSGIVGQVVQTNPSAAGHEESFWPPPCQTGWRTLNRSPLRRTPRVVNRRALGSPP